MYVVRLLGILSSISTPRTQDTTTFSRFTLSVSRDPVSSACDRAGVGIAPGMRTDCALLDCIPVDSCLCGVRLDGSVRVNSSQLRRHCLFVISVNSPTDGSSSEVKEEFYCGVG